MDIDATLSEDFQELSLERSIQTFKSDEELERLTVDEKLPPIERSVYLLSSGQEVQRISVITTLPDLLKENNADCMRRVVPKVREVLHVAQTDMQLAACSAFLQILQNDLVPVANYTQTFLQTILMSLDSRNPEVANAWLETLLDVIDLLPKDVIKRDILPVAIGKGQITKPVQSRLACCRILGKVATKFEPFVIKKDILPTVQSLCQDVDYEVRGCMCYQLDAVARGLGLEQTKSAILPELVELTKDEESHVQLAGLDTVVQILSLLDDETCSSTIVPLVCKFCQQALSSESSTLPAVARHIGKLAHGLAKNLSDEQRLWFISHYKKLCKTGILSEKEREKKEKESLENSSHKIIADESPPSSPMFPPLEEDEDPLVECRKNAAFNFPAMVLFVGAKSFRSDLYITFSHLCSDPNYKVRRSASAGFHEVAKLLGNNSHHILGDLINLLKDDASEVIQGLVSHLPETLEILHKSVHHGSNANAEAKQGQFCELIPALLATESVVASGHNWRLQEELMSQWTILPNVFSSDQIFQKFVPLMFTKLNVSRALPVRVSACKTLLLLLRHNEKLEQRTQMCHRLVEELCHSRSCRQRSLFIDACNLVLDLFSRSFFKEFFFEYLLDLSTDKVANIRLRLCPMLPRLKAIVKLPTDRMLLQQLEACVRKLLLTEKDRDVLEVLEKAVGHLDRVEVQMESLTKKAYFDEDLQDQKKEEEEKKLIEKEEKEKKEEESRSAKGERRKDKSKESKIPAPKKEGEEEEEDEASDSVELSYRVSVSCQTGVDFREESGKKRTTGSPTIEFTGSDGSPLTVKRPRFLPALPLAKTTAISSATDLLIMKPTVDVAKYITRSTSPSTVGEEKVITAKLSMPSYDAFNNPSPRKPSSYSSVARPSSPGRIRAFSSLHTDKLSTAVIRPLTRSSSPRPDYQPLKPEPVPIPEVPTVPSDEKKDQRDLEVWPQLAGSIPEKSRTSYNKVKPTFGTFGKSRAKSLEPMIEIGLDSIVEAIPRDTPKAMPPNALPPKAMPPIAMPPEAMPPKAMPPKALPQMPQSPELKGKKMDRINNEEVKKSEKMTKELMPTYYEWLMKERREMEVQKAEKRGSGTTEKNTDSGKKEEEKDLPLLDSILSSYETLLHSQLRKEAADMEGLLYDSVTSEPEQDYVKLRRYSGGDKLLETILEETMEMEATSNPTEDLDVEIPFQDQARSKVMENMETSTSIATALGSSVEEQTDAFANSSQNLLEVEVADILNAAMGMGEKPLEDRKEQEGYVRDVTIDKSFLPAVESSTDSLCTDDESKMETNASASTESPSLPMPDVCDVEPMKWAKVQHDQELDIHPATTQAETIPTQVDPTAVQIPLQRRKKASQKMAATSEMAIQADIDEQAVEEEKLLNRRSCEIAIQTDAEDNDEMISVVKAVVEDGDKPDIVMHLQSIQENSGDALVGDNEASVSERENMQVNKENEDYSAEEEMNIDVENVADVHGEKIETNADDSLPMMTVSFAIPSVVITPALESNNENMKQPSRDEHGNGKYCLIAMGTQHHSDNATEINVENACHKEILLVSVDGSNKLDKDEESQVDQGIKLNETDTEMKSLNEKQESEMKKLLIDVQHITDSGQDKGIEPNHAAAMEGDTAERENTVQDVKTLPMVETDAEIVNEQSTVQNAGIAETNEAEKISDSNTQENTLNIKQAMSNSASDEVNEKNSASDEVKEKNSASDEVKNSASDEVNEKNSASDEVKNSASDEVKEKNSASDEVKNSASDEVKEKNSASDEVKEKNSASDEVKEKNSASDEVKEKNSASDEVKEKNSASDEVKEKNSASDEVKEKIENDTDCTEKESKVDSQSVVKIEKPSNAAVEQQDTVEITRVNVCKEAEGNKSEVQDMSTDQIQDTKLTEEHVKSSTNVSSKHTKESESSIETPTSLPTPRPVSHLLRKARSERPKSMSKLPILEFKSGSDVTSSPPVRRALPRSVSTGNLSLHNFERKGRSSIPRPKSGIAVSRHGGDGPGGEGKESGRGYATLPRKLPSWTKQLPMEPGKPKLGTRIRPRLSAITSSKTVGVKDVFVEVTISEVSNTATFKFDEMGMLRLQEEKAENCGSAENVDEEIKAESKPDEEVLSPVLNVDAEGKEENKLQEAVGDKNIDMVSNVLEDDSKAIKEAHEVAVCDVEKSADIEDKGESTDDDFFDCDEDAPDDNMQCSQQNMAAPQIGQSQLAANIDICSETNTGNESSDKSSSPVSPQTEGEGSNTDVSNSGQKENDKSSTGDMCYSVQPESGVPCEDVPSREDMSSSGKEQVAEGTPKPESVLEMLPEEDGEGEAVVPVPAPPRRFRDGAQTRNGLSRPNSISSRSITDLHHTAGSKIPAATSLSEKGRAERSGSFAGMPSPSAVNKDVKRTPSFNNKSRSKGSGSNLRSCPTSPRLGTRGGTTSSTAASRKGSATSSSTSLPRRSSIPSTSSAADVPSTRKSSTSSNSLSQNRRISTGSMAQNTSHTTRRVRKDST